MSPCYVIIIINEKINVAFSHRTARTHNHIDQLQLLAFELTRVIVYAPSRHCRRWYSKCVSQHGDN